MLQRAHSDKSTPRLMPIAGWVLLLLIAAACSPGAPAETEAPTISGPPEVTISAPSAGDVYQQGAPVNILANISNAGSDIARVAVRVDGQIVGEAIQPNESGAASFPVSNSWTAATAGEHTISVVATRLDGATSNEASVTIQVEGEDDPPTPTESTEPQPTATENTGTDDTSSSQGETENPTPVPAQPQPTATPTESQPPTNTPVPATATPSVPTANITQGVNVRSGPSTAFNVIGSYAAGETPEALAITPNGGWYKIRYYNNEGWITASVVSLQGDPNALPREAGPPTPIPATNTPVATNTPTAVADLSIVDWSTNPGTPQCLQQTTTTVTVVNTGSGNSGATTVAVEDLFNGQISESNTANIPALAPQESATVSINLTISTNFSQGHTLRARVDPSNTVNETNENNNARTYDYVLGQGSC